jgi:hypothetical protein
MLKTKSKVLDVENIKNVMGFGFENKGIYLSSYISLVTESIFFEEKGKGLINSNFPSGFLSEKIWKPIGHCQPFILIGPAKSLQYIKERYQFKTFHPFIDEDYDNELNDELRLELIQKEIEKFSNKTENEKIEFLNEVKDICIYNQEKFLSFGFEMDNPVEDNPELASVYQFLQH